jgi:site-specific DNA recombinase
VRTAAYARYSSDQQSSASLEDQLRNCRAFCERQGWPAPVVYSDAAISGARNDRPGYQRLLAESSRFDVILVDDLTRLSRDSIETAQALRGLQFRGVRVIGVSDGVDTSAKGHKVSAGLRGLMGELYLDDLREKTHRGLAGRALSGASAGGLPFGYRVTSTGQRAIDEAQAAVVRRIFAEYLQGRSARLIAAGLNADGIPSSRGGTWAQSAIFGDRARGIGILANPIYAGQMIWNRSRFVKHPETGRRIRRERPRSEWVTSAHPELAIVDAATWAAVQRRQRGQAQDQQGKAGRPVKHLLSGLLRCGECGGPLVVVDAYRYGCSAAKDRGTCSSALRVSRKDAEHALLADARAQLLDPKAFECFLADVRAELKRAVPDASGSERKLASAERVRENLMAALRAGIITPGTKSELLAAEAAVDQAKAELLQAKAIQPARILPRAREAWERMVATLSTHARNVPELREALRQSFGEEIPVFINENGDPVARVADSQISMVAGAGFGPYLRGPRQVLLAKSRE